MATPTRAMHPEQAHVQSEGWGIYHQLIGLVAGRKGTAADDLGPASAVSVAVHKPVQPNQAESKEWQGKSVSKQAVAAATQFGLASPARQGAQSRPRRQTVRPACILMRLPVRWLCYRHILSAACSPCVPYLAQPTRCAARGRKRFTGPSTRWAAPTRSRSACLSLAPSCSTT
eukprot:scaffold2611_cov114-Isochrysis_galbana.AAC.10